MNEYPTGAIPLLHVTVFIQITFLYITYPLIQIYNYYLIHLYFKSEEKHLKQKKYILPCYIFTYVVTITDALYFFMWI